MTGSLHGKLDLQLVLWTVGHMAPACFEIRSKICVSKMLFYHAKKMTIYNNQLKKNKSDGSWDVMGMQMIRNVEFTHVAQQCASSAWSNKFRFLQHDIPMNVFNFFCSRSFKYGNNHSQMSTMYTFPRFHFLVYRCLGQAPEFPCCRDTTENNQNHHLNTIKPKTNIQ